MPYNFDKLYNHLGQLYRNLSSTPGTVGEKKHTVLQHGFKEEGERDYIMQGMHMTLYCCPKMVAFLNGCDRLK